MHADIPSGLGHITICVTGQLNDFLHKVGTVSCSLGIWVSFSDTVVCFLSVRDGELNVTLCSSLRPDTHTGIAHIPFYFTDYMSHAELSSNPHCIPDTLLNPWPRPVRTSPSRSCRRAFLRRIKRTAKEYDYACSTPGLRQIRASESCWRAGHAKPCPVDEQSGVLGAKFDFGPCQFKPPIPRSDGYWSLLSMCDRP